MDDHQRIAGFVERKAGRLALFEKHASVNADAAMPATRWACHLHKASSSSNCEIGLLDDHLYHIVPVKETTIHAQKNYNSRTENDEFWEQLPPGNWYSTLNYTSLVNDYDVFAMVVKLLRDLDDRSLVYHQYNNPSDFVKRHIITDCRSTIALCNKHLLKQVKRKQKQVKYSSKAWVRNIVRSLFPKAASLHKNIPTSTPSWALDILALKLPPTQSFHTTDNGKTKKDEQQHG